MYLKYLLKCSIKLTELNWKKRSSETRYKKSIYKRRYPPIHILFYKHWFYGYLTFRYKNNVSVIDMRKHESTANHLCLQHDMSEI